MEVIDRELPLEVDVWDLPPIVGGPRLVCECNRDDCRVLAEVRDTDEGLTLRFSEPTDQFVLHPATLADEVRR